jgi:hypothetical protein
MSANDPDITPNSLGFRRNANQSGLVWIKVDLCAFLFTSIEPIEGSPVIDKC